MKIKIRTENNPHIKGKRSRKITNNPIEIDDRILFKLNYQTNYVSYPTQLGVRKC